MEEGQIPLGSSSQGSPYSLEHSIHSIYRKFFKSSVSLLKVHTGYRTQCSSILVFICFEFWRLGSSWICQAVE
uniref:Uncharacterized protein n=1 Tax=Sphaerodactylus townsendi TaxID=933632 RepID=A0ACB8G2E9_9SAUR